MKPVAAVDFGSNTVSYLVGRVESGCFVESERDGRFVRLGEGVRTNGNLSRAAVARTLDWVVEIARRLEDARVESVRAVGTEALRIADNRADLRSAVEKILGVELEIITGVDEARLAFEGVRWRYPDGPLAVADIGGGSMELVLAQEGGAAACFSLPIGSVMLTEECGEDWPELIRRVSAVLEGLPDAPLGLGELTVVGGSGETLAMLDRGASLPTEAVVEGHIVTIGRARALRDLIRSRGSDERAETFALPRRRADIVIAAMAALEGVADRWRLPAFRATRYCLRHGVVRSICAAP